MSDLRLLSMESLFLASVSGLLTIKSLAGLGLRRTTSVRGTIGTQPLLPAAEAALTLATCIYSYMLRPS